MGVTFSRQPTTNSTNQKKEAAQEHDDSPPLQGRIDEIQDVPALINNGAQLEANLTAGKVNPNFVLRGDNGCLVNPLIHIAVALGNVQAVKVLLKHGAKVNVAGSVLRSTHRGGSYSSGQTVIRCTLLERIIRSQNDELELLRLVLDAGENVHTLIHDGWRGSEAEAPDRFPGSMKARVLKDKDYTTNTNNTYKNKYDTESWCSPFTLACRLGKMDVARLLLEYGASVNLRYGNQRETLSALREAVIANNVALARFLITECDAHLSEFDENARKTLPLADLCVRHIIMQGMTTRQEVHLYQTPKWRSILKYRNGEKQEKKKLTNDEEAVKNHPTLNAKYAFWKKEMREEANYRLRRPLEVVAHSVEMLQLLFEEAEEKADYRRCTIDEVNPLHHACYRGDMPSVKYLIERCRVRTDNKGKKEEEEEDNGTEIKDRVQAYVNTVANWKVPVFHAVASDTFTAVKFCLMGRCTKEVPPKPTDLDYYSKDGDPEWPEEYPLLYPDQPLRFYCLHNDSFRRYTSLSTDDLPQFSQGSHLEIVRYLVTRCGADVNLDNPLQLAIANKDIAAADLLLTLGANCDEDTARSLENTRAVVAEGPPGAPFSVHFGSQNYTLRIKPGMTVRKVKEQLALKAGVPVDTIGLRNWDNDSAILDEISIWRFERRGLRVYQKRSNATGDTQNPAVD